MISMKRTFHQRAGAWKGPWGAWMHSLPSARNRLIPFVVALVLFAAAPAGASIFLVTSSADSGGGSLRSIIAAANADGSPPATINFSIGGCPCIITLLSDLPALTQSTEINGYTETGATVNTAATGTNANLKIDLNANGFQALHFTAASSRVRGLVIRGAVGDGVLIDTSANGTTVDGNFIGTNRTGTAAGPGNGLGITAHLVSGVTIGGTAPAARNLISGNVGYGAYLSSTTDSSIEGNLIGTNAAGTGAVPNATAAGTAGVQIGNVGGAATGNTVGGAAAARNVISGNGSDGVQILSENVHDNFVQGNYIGLGADGTTALGNGRHGVVLYHYAAGTPSSGNMILDNVIANHPRKAIAIDGPVFTMTTVSNNLIGTAADGTTPMPNGSATDPAIDLLNAATATIADNRILNSVGTGLLIRQKEFPGDPVLGDGLLLAGSDGNCVVFNGDGVVNTTGASNTFQSNWWGTSDGPSGSGPGSGDSVSADVDYSSFLMTAPMGCPTYGVDLSLTKMADVANPNLGQNVVFTLTASNAGPGPADDVTVTDTLPASFTFVSTSGCVEDPNGVPTCTLGTIAPGGMAQYTITATANALGTAVNQATVTSSQEELGPGNETASATVTIGAPVVTIPTLGSLGMILLGLVLAALGFAFLRPRS